ncbi:MAG TPA: isoprenylcysteine carboxylmethyltransferase family protein [Caulobacteraceae bacterium]|jgi:protein-S-isoprenylcysteine O-methyltransferase Ste14
MSAWLSPLGAIYAVWIVWMVSWELAGLWSSRAQATPGIRLQSSFRVFTSVGFLLLLITPPWPWGLGGWKRIYEQPLLKTLTAPLWSTPETLGWVLAGVALAGLLFCWWARVHLGALWSSAITRKADHRIVDTGPYGLVRHPIYTGILTLGLAIALDKATPIALVGLLSLCVGYWMKSRMEEGFLRSELGADAYDAYRARVPMLIPFLPTKR